MPRVQSWGACFWGRGHYWGQEPPGCPRVSAGLLFPTPSWALAGCFLSSFSFHNLGRLVFHSWGQCEMPPAL